jgi:PAS domain S-box-containing protein
MKPLYKDMMSASPLPLSQFLSFGVAMCAALNELHKKDQVHTDIRPQNIQWYPENSKVELAHAAEGGNASLFSDTRLPYISPEQTGRMNRRVDYRTDLYSLGVVFYELLTGEPPFLSDDSLEMIHSHIAKKPAPAHEINADIPEPISAIIMRLLEKNAIDRYQSVFGLRRDLERSIEQLDAEGSIQPFELGESDFTGVFLIPQKLYGREDEVRGLLETFERVSEGTAELLLVAGYSGVGKTALVHEVQKSITVKRGYFIEGKFDQYQRNIPYSAWGQALGGFVTHLLMESESQLENWKAQILEAVGLSGNLLTDMIPNLELVIGPQPDVPELDGQATQNRLNYVFQRFIKVIARKEHTLVVFLDDLQWIDSASLNFLKTLLTDSDQAHCLIIGAYRDNEVEATHPLMVGVAELQETHVKLERLTLNSLLETDVNSLCSDTLRCLPSESRPLAQLVYSKTGGNAFFTHRLLHALHEDQLLVFDSSHDRWRWDLDALNQLELADNVIDLMIVKVRSLPEAMQEILQLAGCIGNQFDLSTLAMLAQQPVEAVSTVLETSLRENILLPVEDLYKFAHDRIQQAVYSLIHPDARVRLHRRIGFSLLENTSADEIDEKVFDIVGHFNQALDSIDTEEDRLRVSELNLKAGQKAKSASAFVQAKEYIEVGLDLLREDSWQHQYDLTLSLHNENGYLAALTGQFEQVDATAILIQTHAKTILDQVRIYMVRIEVETSKSQLAKALEIGLKVLKELGIEIPTQPGEEDYQRLTDRFVSLLSSRSIEHWGGLPLMTDKTALAASAILAAEMSTAYAGNPSLYPIIALKSAILSLEFGLNTWSPFFFGNVGLLTLASISIGTDTSVAFEKIQFTREVYRMMCEMMENPVTARSRSKSLNLLVIISPWIEPIEKGIELSKASFRSGYEQGDFLYSSYATYLFAVQAFASGMNLEAYQSQLSNQTDGLIRLGQKTGYYWVMIYQQTAQNFKETSLEPHRLQGSYFDEDEWLPGALENDVTSLHNLSINKLILVYHFDLDDKLDEHVLKAADLLIGGPAMFSMVLFYLYFALSKLRLVGEINTKDHAETINLVDSYLQLLGVWSISAPTSFQHMYDLISAEKARVTGDLDGALSHFELAISGARANGFIHEEALANELYARFWIERDNARFADPLMDEAHSLYLKWGATAKAEHLVKRYPECMAKARVPTANEAALSDQRLADHLDLHTILKASQKMAGEIELESLLANMMDIVIENAGAQTGFLLMEEDGRWMVVASGGFESSEALVQEPQDVGVNEVVSQGIVNYVIRTQESVVLMDAFNEGDFTHDNTIQQRQSKSVLCTPLIDQGRTSGVLYLENNLTIGAFTVKRVELLNLLSSQMAMALNNVKLYSNLNAKVAETIEREERFRGTFEQAAVGIAHVSTEGKFIRINQKFCEIVGYSKDEMLDLDFQHITHPDDLEIDLEHIRQVLKGERNNYSLEKRYYRKDGSLIWVNLTVSLLLDDLGEPKHFVSVISDITQSKRVAERLRAMSSELIFTEERERQRIASDLHDGPAQSLALALLQLEEATEVVAGSTPEIMVDAASQQVHQSLRQIRSVLLDLSSPTLHQMGLSAGLSDWLDENIRDKHGLRTMFRDQCGDVLLAEEMSLLLFRNACELLTNVVKHGQAQRVSVKMACLGQTLQIVVEDDGVGFDQDSADKHPDYSGGFGLFSIGVRMVDVGGSLEIVSAPGKGCKATLVAPLEPAGAGGSP